MRLTSTSICTGIALCLSACGPPLQSITTEVFVEQPFEVVAQGSDARERTKGAYRCYDRSCNVERHPAAFRKTYALDEIDYRGYMLIEIFLGKTKVAGRQLRLEKVRENRDRLEVHYSINAGRVGDVVVSPFIMARVPRSYKHITYFENGEAVLYPTPSAGAR